MKKDLFEHKSKKWDMSSKRVENAKNISNVILKNIDIEKYKTILDLGAGTGLLSYFISPKIKNIIAIDNSPSMLNELREKRHEFPSCLEVVESDIFKYNHPTLVDGIISSMTIHHIQDIKALFVKLFNMIKVGGFIAIADLDSEDGTFHSNNEGVYHFGFDRIELKKVALEAGFDNIHFETANIIKKPHRDFTIFTMIAKKS